MRTEDLAGVGVRVVRSKCLAPLFRWCICLDVVPQLDQDPGSTRSIVSIPMPFIVLDIVAGLGPLVAALAATSYEAGGAGRRALLGQLLRWRVPVAWYIVAILGPVVLAAAAFGLWVATSGFRPRPMRPLRSGPCCRRTLCTSLSSVGDWTRSWVGEAMHSRVSSSGTVRSSPV